MTAPAGNTALTLSSPKGSPRVGWQSPRLTGRTEVWLFPVLGSLTMLLVWMCLKEGPWEGCWFRQNPETEAQSVPWR